MKKVINDLVGYKNIKIVQCNEYFNFSLDSVLLPNFVTLNDGVKNIIDLGCGNAPIPLILSTKTKANIYGVEVQNEIYNLALETVALNKLENRIKIINDDIKNLKNLFSAESFDLVLSNPPYFKKIDSSILNNNVVKTNARHETLITLEELISMASYLLKNKGKLGLIHRTERLDEIVSIMVKYNLIPKRMRFIYPTADSESNLILIEAVKNANSGLKVLKPLYVHNSNGNYTKEVLEMFE